MSLNDVSTPQRSVSLHRCGNKRPRVRHRLAVFMFSSECNRGTRNQEICARLALSGLRQLKGTILRLSCPPPLAHRRKIKADLVAISISARAIRILCKIRHHRKELARLSDKQSHVC